VQMAFQILVAESLDALASHDDLLWDSGKIDGDASILQPYTGPELRSGQRCYWQVRAWDGQGEPTAWSEPASWEMGLLSAEDWTAEWIEPDLDLDPTASHPCPMVRKTFDAEDEIASARLYITAHGLYEAEINGQRVGCEVLTPGWTAYDARLQYQTYDVTDMLTAGQNAIGITLGDGWYRGNLPFSGSRNLYGEKLALLFQIRVEYADGRAEVFGSDTACKTATGPILASDIYNGETYDARLEKPGWSQADYDDSAWSGVTAVDHSKDVLVAPMGPTILKIEELEPVEILTTPEGDLVVDMGQNMVGWLRLQVQGPTGTTVTIRHAEVLDKEGNFYTDNLRSADQTDTYTLKGEGVEVYEPTFTFHGFRYVAIDGYPGELTLDALTGVVVHSDTEPIGHWESDHELLNQLQHNIIWGQKGNFVDVPTDCPQRDERLGWTGDAQVFIRTACFNMDVAAFFTKWLRDLAAEQGENGSVPHVIPDALSRAMGGGGSSAWADASVICPWTIYLCYGDKRILQEQYESMAAWVGYMEEKAGENYLWQTGFHFGDWLSFNSPDPAGTSAITDRDLIATAFFAYSTSLVQKTAEILGKTEDARRYADLVRKVKNAFCAEFVSPNGRVANNTQTAYVLALMFDLLPEGQRLEAAQRLAKRVRDRGDHLSTGFVGTPYLCHVLSQHGQIDVAYDLLVQESYPSWLYPVTQGATTIWERWDGQKPDGTFQDVGMNSFNHYAYGAVGEWMVRVVAGIEIHPAAPGYKHTLIQPRPGGGLTRVSASVESPYGLVASAWQVTDDGFALQVTVPANTTATVRLPAAQLEVVTEGGVGLDQVPGITGVAQEGDDVVLKVGSGSYAFAYASPFFVEYKAGVGKLSTKSPLFKILADERALEIVRQHLPPRWANSEEPLNERIAQVSLRQAARFTGGALSDEVLDQIDAELQAL